MKDERNRLPANILEQKRGFWMRHWKERDKNERGFCMILLFLTFCLFFSGTMVVKIYAAEYSFTKYEYHKLMQNTCLMGEKAMDDEGIMFRVITLRGPRLAKDGKFIGETIAFFGVNQDGDTAVLNIVTMIKSNGKETATIVILSDADLDGKPDREGDGMSELHEVSEEGKIHWNVWIVRFIEEVVMR